MSALSEVLGAEPAPSITALPADAQAELAELIAAARVRQSESLVTAFDATFKHVPLPVRGIVRKVLLG
jgi:hypothetical protein